MIFLIQEFLDGLKINGRGNYVEEIYGFISTAISMPANSIITRYLDTELLASLSKA